MLYSTLLTKVKHFLYRLRGRQFFTFLCFFALSTVFWLFTNLNETKERRFSIPLRFANVPKHVVFTTEPPTAISLTLSDRGFVLLRYLQGNYFDTLIVDWKKLQLSKMSCNMPVDELLKERLTKLESTTKILGRNPEVLAFTFNYGEQKTVPVQLQGVFGADSAYTLMSVDVEPQQVQVYASDYALDTIRVAKTEFIHLKQLTDTVQRSLRLLNTTGVKFVPSMVNLRVQVDRLVEKTVEVPVQGVNFPADVLLRIFPSKVKISFQVGAKNYKNIDASDFVLVINYEELRNKEEQYYDLHLKSVPEHLKHVRLSPARVEYILETRSPAAL